MDSEAPKSFGEEALNVAAQVTGAALDIVGGAAEFTGNLFQGSAPAGTAIGHLGTEVISLAGTTVALANSFTREANNCVNPLARIVRAPLETLSSIAEMAFCPIKRTAQTTTTAINRGFDALDRRLFGQTLSARPA